MQVERITKNYRFRADHEGYIGLLFQCTQGNIEFGIDTEQQCCEMSGYLVFEHGQCFSCTSLPNNIQINEIKAFNGVEEDFSYIYPSCSANCGDELGIGEEYEPDELSDCYFELNCTVDGKERTFYILFYNIHNGYYSHSVRLRSQRWNYLMAI